MKFEYNNKKTIFIDPLTNNEFEKYKSLLCFHGSNIHYVRSVNNFSKTSYFYCELTINNHELSIEEGITGRLGEDTKYFIEPTLFHCHIYKNCKDESREESFKDTSEVKCEVEKDLIDFSFCVDEKTFNQLELFFSQRLLQQISLSIYTENIPIIRNLTGGLKIINPREQNLKVNKILSEKYSIKNIENTHFSSRQIYSSKIHTFSFTSKKLSLERHPKYSQTFLKFFNMIESKKMKKSFTNIEQFINLNKLFRTEKNILKRLFVVIDYFIFLFSLIWIGGGFFSDQKEFVIGGIILLGISSLFKYIIFGRLLIFPWSKEKVDE